MSAEKHDLCEFIEFFKNYYYFNSFAKNTRHWNTIALPMKVNFCRHHIIRQRPFSEPIKEG